MFESSLRNTAGGWRCASICDNRRPAGRSEPTMTPTETVLAFLAELEKPGGFE